MTRAIPLLLLSACAGGPRPETLIEGLTWVAAVADPPVVPVGERYTLTATLADPEGHEPDVLVWSCVPELGCDAITAPVVDGTVTVERVATAPLPVWMLACSPGSCGDLEATSDAVLVDPTTWLETLPIRGVAAATRLTRIGEPGEGNPSIDEAPEGPLSARVGEEVALTFLVSGAETAYGLSTIGGFSGVAFDVSIAGRVTLTFVGSPEPGAGQVYVVFDDGAGGTALWTETVDVAAR